MNSAETIRGNTVVTNGLLRESLLCSLHFYALHAQHTPESTFFYNFSEKKITDFFLHNEYWGNFFYLISKDPKVSNQEKRKGRLNLDCWFKSSNTIFKMIWFHCGYSKIYGKKRCVSVSGKQARKYMYFDLQFCTDEIRAKENFKLHSVRKFLSCSCICTTYCCKVKLFH